MQLKLTTKVLTLCSKSEKLSKRVFHSLPSCSFTFAWWTFVTFRTTYCSCIFLGSFWRRLWPSALDAGTDQAMLFQITAAGEVLFGEVTVW